MALLFICTINFKSIVTIHFFLNQTELTELFCINKEKPELNCDGKCHLKKELVKIEDTSNELPFSQNAISSNLELNSTLASNNTNLIDVSSIRKKKWIHLSKHTIERYSNVLSPPPKV